jgi:hypothetical protein
MPANRKKRPDCPWVVCRAGDPHSAGECTRCGEKLMLGFPVAVNVLCAAIDAFIENHLHCKEPEEKSQ